MPKASKSKKTVRLKKPKKLKPPILKSKGRVSCLADMENIFEKDNKKKLQIQIDNQNVRRDSDYESESSDTEPDDETAFNPTIQYGNRPDIVKAKKEKIEFTGIDVIAMPTQKDAIPERYLIKEKIIPRGYSNFILINGSINSGKTVCLINMILNPLIYGRDGSGKTFFDNLYLFSGTEDDAYDILIEQKILKPNNIKRNPTSKDLKKVLDMIKQTVSSCNGDLTKVPISMIIFDDIVNNLEFIKSKEFKAIAVHPRQYFIFGVCLSQYIQTVPKLVRMQCQNLILFQGNAAEAEIYTETYCPPNINKKDFRKVLDIAWQKTDECKHSFLHIVRGCPIETRFRRNFDTIIDIDNLNN